MAIYNDYSIRQPIQEIQKLAKVLVSRDYND
jgi:hypothetical protein